MKKVWETVSGRQRIYSMVLGVEILCRSIAYNFYPTDARDTPYKTLVQNTWIITLIAGLAIIVSAAISAHSEKLHLWALIVGHYLGFTFTINLALALMIGAINHGTSWVAVPAFTVIAGNHFARALYVGRSM